MAKKDIPLNGRQRALVEKSLPLVRWTIQQYIARNEGVVGLGFDDLCQEGAIALSSQQMLSTAELIKCIETDTTDISTDIKLLDALYVDSETTCDNIPLLMRTAKSRQSVTAAVANLYLRKQIILERV